jgi:O-acetyl-ADP-ribose deacetylase (regulator of RNase III)
MESERKVAPEEAALSLSKDLQREPWFSTVGLGEEPSGTPALFVYVKTATAARSQRPKEWRGYKVFFKHVVPRPARHGAANTLQPAAVVASRLPGINQTRAWTNSSVRKLMRVVGNDDPVRAVTQRARDVVLEAMDRGWTGPPFDPLQLADHLGIVVSPRYDIRDARTVPAASNRLRIEYNPNRPGARVRYSIAHEIAHTLFPDCADHVRNRSPHTELKGDQWQLEAMCNVGAAEILMPLGSVKGIADSELTIESLLELRKQFDVSMEALLIRVVRLAKTPLRMFCASRVESGENVDQFVLNYSIASQTWPSDVGVFQLAPRSSALSECTAIGFTTNAVETWGPSRVRVEAVGIPPYPGSHFPRVVGILKPVGKSETVVQQRPLLRFVRGDVLKPRGEGPRIVVHVVNDKTPNWGGGGLAEAIKRRWPEIQHDFREAWTRDRESLRLGGVRICAAGDGIFVASVVAQKGYGESARPRIRYAALRKGLQNVAATAARKMATVHMPRIGAGQGRGSWAVIEDIIQTVFWEAGVSVTIYDLPGAPIPQRMALQEELSFAQ